MVVRVAPAVELRAQSSETLSIRIRLAPQTVGWIWRADTCDGPGLNAYVLSRSGNYEVPVMDVKGEGKFACLSSSDGQLRVLVALIDSR